MIPRIQDENQCKSKAITKNKAYYTDPLELLKQLDLTPQQMFFSADAAKEFRFKVPASYVDKIESGDPDDPLLKQIFPVQNELEPSAAYSKDPLEESNSLCQPGLLQKYDGRALMLVTPSCAINCRYCFRRHYPYDDQGHLWGSIKKNVQLIRQDPSIKEVILSGGDPLSLSNARLTELISMLELIPHIKRLRFHSRFPIVEPGRINDELLQALSNNRFQIIMVLHINHAQEMGSDTQISIEKLRKKNVILLNQSVLLKGVNDNVETLRQLSELLIEHHIIPYYLHMLDKVQGSAHFEVSDSHASRIYQQLRDALPGYMLPRLVREIAGEKSKLPV